ncbi:UNVERIFIED_CONTAM: hypothetical protein FKN15_073102 [Acipenser sinensis]
MNGSLRTGQKSLLVDELTKGINSPPTIEIPKGATLIIDGKALVLALGRPNNAKTFGDFADAFAQSVYHSGSGYARIDVVFDRYNQDSIKAGTRAKRRGAPT